MDTNKHTQLIARLKRQPRHGAGLGPLSSAIDAGIGAVTITQTLIPALEQLDNASSNAVRGLDSFVGMQEFLNTKLIEGTKATLYLEGRNKELNKSFGINSITAGKFANSLQSVAKTLGINGKQAQQYAISLKKILPVIDQLAATDNTQYKGLMRIQQVMTTNLGLTEEQAAAYTGFATQRGKDAQESLVVQYNLSKEIDSQTGMLGSFKLISEGIAETAEDVQLQYGKMPGNLELAIVKASKLGFKMSDLKKTADNLLNIESSIGQELEYQLLSGRRLVGSEKGREDLRGKSLTNAYREASLQGNGVKQANVLNAILEQEGKTLSNNLFARKQMSDLLGMDEASLARALQKKSILESLPGGDSLFDKTGEELLSAAKSMGATEDQMTDLIDNQDTRTYDQKMVQELEILNDVLIKKFAPEQAAKVAETRAAAGKAMTKIAISPDAITDALEAVGFAGGLGSAKQAQLVVDETFDLSATGGSMKVARASDTEALNVDTTTAKDMLSPPSGYGTRTLMGPEGAIQLNNRDTVIAGTNLFDKSSIDNASLENTMMQVGLMIVAAIKSGGTIGPNLEYRYSK